MTSLKVETVNRGEAQKTHGLELGGLGLFVFFGDSLDYSDHLDGALGHLHDFFSVCFLVNWQEEELKSRK